MNTYWLFKTWCDSNEVRASTPRAYNIQSPEEAKNLKVEEILLVNSWPKHMHIFS